MKPVICLFIIAFPVFAFAQNVGIGISDPTRAKLEVNGAAGATSAIFGGESTGMSLQRNFPSIGFNQYYSTNSKFIGTGYASNFYLDPNSGVMGLDMLGTGAYNTSTNVQNRAFTIAKSGNVSVRSTNVSGTSLFVDKPFGNDGTAGFAGRFHTSYFNFGEEEHTYIRAGKDNGIVYINDIPGGRITMKGPVGINTSTPGSALEIRQMNSRGLMLVEPGYFNNWQLNVGASYGSLMLLCNGLFVGSFDLNGAYTHSSDERLKKISASCLQLWKKLCNSGLSGTK